MGSIKCRHDILGGGPCLNIVRRTEHKSAAGCKCLNPLTYLVLDLVDRHERQFLNVNASTPKAESVAKFLFENHGFHARGPGLDRIQDVDAHA